jgi:hypothetical protein
VNKITAQRLGCLAALATLTACGDGGASQGEGSAVIVSPPPTANPPPNVPQPTPPAFGALGQTTSQQFAVLGFAFDGADAGFGYTQDTASLDFRSAVGLRLLAPSQLFLTIPSYGEAMLVANGGSGTDGQGRTLSLSYSTLGGGASLSVADAGGTRGYLQSTGFGSWVSGFRAGLQFPYRVVSFVYGVPTKPGDVPTSGTLIYDSSYPDDQPFTVDFGARTVSGTILVHTEEDTRTYSIRDVVFTADGTSFQGRLTTGNAALDGSIEGRFNGPAASEMMGRYQVPSGQSQDGGIFAKGKR